MKLVGVNNIVILPLNSDNNSSSDNDEEAGKTLKKKYSPGLTLKDAENIQKSIPTVQAVSYLPDSCRSGRQQAEC